MQTNTLRPGLLVSLKTSIRGNVSYQYRDIEPEHLVENGATGQMGDGADRSGPGGARGSQKNSQQSLHCDPRRLRALLVRPSMSGKVRR